MSESTTQIYETFIRTTPEKLWRALIDPEFTKQYFFGTLVATSGKPGEAIVYRFPDGSPCVDGEILAAEPPYKLVHTWIVRYDAELAKERSTITWLIEPRGTVCKLTAVHEMRDAPKTAKHVASEGWSVVLSGLKTLLETGEALVIAPKAG